MAGSVLSLEKVPGFTAPLSVLGLLSNDGKHFAGEQLIIRLLTQLKYQAVLRAGLKVIDAGVLLAPTGQRRGFIFDKQAQVHGPVRMPLYAQLFLTKRFLLS